MRATATNFTRFGEAIGLKPLSRKLQLIPMVYTTFFNFTVQFSGRKASHPCYSSSWGERRTICRLPKGPNPQRRIVWNEALQEACASAAFTSGGALRDYRRHCPSENLFPARAAPDDDDSSQREAESPLGVGLHAPSGFYGNNCG